VARFTQGNRFPNRRPNKRIAKWAFGPDAQEQTIEAATVTAWSTFVTTGEPQETIVRTRGFIEFILTAVTTPGGGFSGAVGLGKVTIEAANAGVVSIPSPVTDADWDGWFWHSFFQIHSITGTIADGANAAAVSLRIPIDSKAMRKFTDQDAVVGIIETVREIGVVTMLVSAEVRHLVKLS